MLADTSVVIPALNEEEQLGPTLASLTRARADDVLVVDGGSTDGTARVARSHPGVRLLHAPAGRARQQNRGAAAARGKWLWFLHADTRPGAEAIDLLAAAQARPLTAWGAFRLRIDGDESDPYLRWIEHTVHWRTLLFGLPYGDQGLFVRRDLFQRVGGFRPQAPCEDLDLVLRLRRSARMTWLPAPVATSARAWRRHGRLGATFRNARALAACLHHHYLAPRPEH
jgi:rSAM/selenodomain-associated transferase 2